MSITPLLDRFDEIQDLSDERVDLSLEERFARLEEVRAVDPGLCQEVEVL